MVELLHELAAKDPCRPLFKKLSDAMKLVGLNFYHIEYYPESEISRAIRVYLNMRNRTSVRNDNEKK